MRVCDGEIFATATLLGNELKGYFKAKINGIGAILHEDHIYLPVNWMSEVDPHAKATGETIVKLINSDLKRRASLN